jgi:hypothetical protein
MAEESRVALPGFLDERGLWFGAHWLARLVPKRAFSSWWILRGQCMRLLANVITLTCCTQRTEAEGSLESDDCKYERRSSVCLAIDGKHATSKTCDSTTRLVLSKERNFSELLKSSEICNRTMRSPISLKLENQIKTL